MNFTNIFAIETSCDETAAAIVSSGVEEISSFVASSKELHEVTGGVVPEVASRKQVEFILPVINECLFQAQKKWELSAEDTIKKIDALAVTVGPGLVGSLVVGVEAAKSLALAWGKPLIPVNHLIGHIYASFLGNSNIEFPCIALVVSGGHTDLVLMKNHGDLQYLGGTIDDAAGEGFDKVARMLGFGEYLGGAALSRAARDYNGTNSEVTFPRSLIKDPNYDFSFSGIKTAVRRLVLTNPEISKEKIAKEFEDAVTDVLVTKTVKAALEYKVKSVLIGGGVSANQTLREKLKAVLLQEGLYLHCPPIRLCTDNAIYIASAAYFNPNSNLPLLADPSLTIMS